MKGVLLGIASTLAILVFARSDDKDAFKVQVWMALAVGILVAIATSIS